MIRRFAAIFVALWTALYPALPARASDPAAHAPPIRETVAPEWSGRLKALFASPEFGEAVRPEIAELLRLADLDDPGVLANYAGMLAQLNLEDFAGETPEARRAQSLLFRASFDRHIGMMTGPGPAEFVSAAEKDRVLSFASDSARALSSPFVAPEEPVPPGAHRTNPHVSLIRQRDAERFLKLPAKLQAGLLLKAPAENRMGLIRLLPAKAAANLIRQAPEAVREDLKTLVDEDTLHRVNALLLYAADQAGGHMDSRFAGLYHPDMPASEAIEYLQELIREKKVESLREAYLLDEQHRLLGVVDYYDLLKADPQAKVSLLARRLQESEKLRADSSQEQIVQFFLTNKMQRAPVLDGEDRVVGIMMAKDVLHVMQSEWDDDFVKMVGARLKGLLMESSFYMARVRSPWLIVTFLLEFFVVASIILHLSGGLPATLLYHLNAYIPVIAAMGGNVGAQTASAIVRGLATGEVERAGGQWKVFRKEVTAGLILGAGFGLLTAAFATIVNAYFFGAYLGWRFAAVVGGGMFMSMTAAAIMGALEPFIFQRIGIDPATATGPLITTFTDIVSNAFYFSMAVFLLS